jgi:hypothetical protein
LCCAVVWLVFVIVCARARKARGEIIFCSSLDSLDVKNVVDKQKNRTYKKYSRLRRTMSSFTNGTSPIYHFNAYSYYLRNYYGRNCCIPLVSLRSIVKLEVVGPSSYWSQQL